MAQGELHDQNLRRHCAQTPHQHSQPSTTLNQIRWLVLGQEGHGPKTVGAGYLTSELGNRTIAWLKGLRADPSQARRPFFVCAPHSFPLFEHLAVLWFVLEGCVAAGTLRHTRRTGRRRLPLGMRTPARLPRARATQTVRNILPLIFVRAWLLAGSLFRRMIRLTLFCGRQLHWFEDDVVLLLPSRLHSLHDGRPPPVVERDRPVRNTRSQAFSTASSLSVLRDC